MSHLSFIYLLQLCTEHDVPGFVKFKVFDAKRKCMNVVVYLCAHVHCHLKGFLQTFGSEPGWNNISSITQSFVINWQ